MTYNFAILALLFLLPGVLIYLLRADLRPVIHVMALCSIPFGFTEFLFYPSYWEPEFLFDLAYIIGFGIEDIVWVIGLSAFTSTAYAAFTGRGYQTIVALTVRDLVRRCAGILAVVFGLVALIAAIGIPMIYGSVAIMLGVTAFMCARRRDLIRPTLLGGLLATGVYTGLCFLFMAIFPGIFELTWHVERFSNIYLLSVPLEEVLYALGAGLAATAFYPYAFAKRFCVRAARASTA